MVRSVSMLLVRSVREPPAKSIDEPDFGHTASEIDAYGQSAGSLSYSVPSVSVLCIVFIFIFFRKDSAKNTRRNASLLSNRRQRSLKAPGLPTLKRPSLSSLLRVATSCGGDACDSIVS